MTPAPLTKFDIGNMSRSEQEGYATPLDDAWAAGYREGHAMALSAHDTAAVLLVAARAVVDWAEMAEGGNVAAEDAMFDRIDQLRAALNAQEADHD